MDVVLIVLALLALGLVLFWKPKHSCLVMLLVAVAVVVVFGSAIAACMSGAS